MTGIRPASVGMIFGVILSLSLENYAPALSLDWLAMAIGALDLVLLVKFTLSIPLVILISAAIGILFGRLPIL